MANTFNGKMWVLDTPAVITDKPVWIRKIRLVPNAAGNAVKFTCWGAQSTAVQSKAAETATVSGANTIVSNGNFATGTINPFQVITITNTTTGNNMGRVSERKATSSYLILSNADNNTITVPASSLTNETSKVYTWDIFNTYESEYIVSPATGVVTEEQDYGDSMREFKNLVLESLTASAKVYVYL